MKRTSAVIPFLVAGLLACQSSSSTETSTSTPELDPTGAPPFTPTYTPTSFPFTATPPFIPTIAITPEIDTPGEVLSVNAQYVSIPSLGIDRMYVNGYSSAPTLTPNLFTQFSLGCRDYSLNRAQKILVPEAVDPSCIALLAHNYMHPGMAIEENMSHGDEVYIQNDVGQVLKYEVEKVVKYQAVPPLGSGQVLVDLESGVVLTADEIMKFVYNRYGETTLGVGENYLVIQTCIWEDTNGNGKKDPGDNGGDNWLWGRMFVIGRLVEVYDQNYLAGDYQLDGME